MNWFITRKVDDNVDESLKQHICCDKYDDLYTYH